MRVFVILVILLPALMRGQRYKNHIKADVIVLGKGLPGILVANNLRKKFGDDMDVVVIDLAGAATNTVSKTGLSVAFQTAPTKQDSAVSFATSQQDINEQIEVEPLCITNMFLTKYSTELNVPLPKFIMEPEENRDKKLFQYINGTIVECTNDYHDFEYLSVMEKFELEQYQDVLDYHMNVIFPDNSERIRIPPKKIKYYDQTSMESHLCGALLLSTSRDVMRTIIRLVCGTNAKNVSLLFYLHQCFRTNGSRNHIDGKNTRFREKTLGYCRHRIFNRLHNNISEIILPIKAISKIRADLRDDLVILEPEFGETDYMCNLLAMALRPNELNDIEMDEPLVSDGAFNLAKSMKENKTKRFIIEYETSFWRNNGFSGDILSVRGPIIRAMERPVLSGTGSKDKYYTLIGYLNVQADNNLIDTYKEVVVAHLVELYGEQAAEPISYRENDFVDLYVPKCGEYMTLHQIVTSRSPKFLEWGTLDIFAEGDISAAIQAGHRSYLTVACCLRPQALGFEDVTISNAARFSAHNRISLPSSVNLITISRALMFGGLVIAGIIFIRVIKR